MKVRTKKYDLNRILKSTAKRFETEVEKGCQELRFALPNAHGTGQLHTFDFEDGLQATILDATLEKEMTWHFQMDQASPFLMFFLVRGEVHITFQQEDEEDLKLQPLQTVFVAHQPNQEQTLIVQPGEPTLLLLLKIEREMYIDHVGCFSKPVTEELSSIFAGDIVIKSFHNGSDYGLQGSGLLQEILEDKQEGLTRATFVEAKILDLFALQLKRWEEDFHEPKGKTNLRPDDIERLVEARNLLLQDLQNAPTIEELAKLCGLNRQKLKKGFKRMFGKTINEFLRNERLRISRQMLSNSESIIREVAAKVGYENASYFARRFREKYGVYPSEYLKILHERAEEE